MSMINLEHGYSEDKPKGLLYLPDFIHEAEETSLIKTIDVQPWIMELKRRVQHYGYRYDYKVRSVANDLWLGELPGWVSGLAKRLKCEGMFEREPDQVIVNEYLPGQGIAAHIDCVPCFGKTVASISLGSACVMDFSHAKSWQKFSCALAPRSVVVLSDEARYQWKHGIAARKSDVGMPRQRRLSLTFRTMA